MNKGKELKDFTSQKPLWHCRFHPTDWWHEVGCPHMDWSKEDLRGALVVSKQSNNYLSYLLSITPKPRAKMYKIKRSDFPPSKEQHG